jgi:prevent-host-death family protein
LRFEDGYLDQMRLVGINALKNNLRAYMRLVRSGEIVLITRRGKLVAELHPVERAGPLSSNFSGATPRPEPSDREIAK